MVSVYTSGVVREATDTHTGFLYVLYASENTFGSFETVDEAEATESL